MSKLHVSIVTPETTTFDQEADSLVVTLFDGEAGILANHAPMIGRLAPGELRISAGGQNHHFYVEGGFVQVLDNKVSVITGNSIDATKIDAAAARKVLAETQIAADDKSEIVEMKNKAMAQARAQIRIAEHA